MGFAQELKDFAKGFRSGVELANQTRTSQAAWEKHRPPTDAELGGEGGVTGAGGEIQVKPGVDPTTTGSTEPGEIESYIREASARYGIDPDVAVRVAQSEGGLTDPYRQGEAMLKYGREESYGPFQLHMRMGGVGERALEDGIDPRKDWKAGVDYALKEASQKGWGQWFGAAKVGVKDWDGIGGPKRKSSSVKTKAPAVASTTPAAKETAIPEEEEAPPVEEEEPEPVEEAEVSFALPEVDLPGVTGWEEYARLASVQPPRLFAQEGGIIPEYAEGGPVVDKYNPSRAYTQPIPESGARPTFTPRRISQPVYPTTPAAGTGGLSSSQQALADARAKAAADKAAAAAAAAAAKPAQPNYTSLQQMQAYDAYKNMMKGGLFGQMGDQGGDRYGHRAAFQRNQANKRQEQYGSPEAAQKWMDSWLAADPQTRRRMGRSMSFFAEGGMVPNVNPEYWEEAVKRERRISSHDSGESARDRAAKRLNRRERGLTSTAVRVGGRSGGEGGGPRIKEKTTTEKITQEGTSTTRNPKKMTDTPPPPGRLSDENAPNPPTPKIDTPPPPGRLSDENAGIPAEPNAPVLPDLQRNPYETQRGEEEFMPEGWLRDWLIERANAKPQAEGGVESPIPGVAAPVDAAHDQPRGGSWAVPGPAAPRNVVSPTPTEQSAPAIPETPVQTAPAIPPSPGGAPGGGPGAPALNANAVADMINDMLPRPGATTSTSGMGPGPGGARFSVETLKNIVTEAVQNGSEQAIAALQGILRMVNSATPAGGNVGGGPGAPGITVPKLTLDGLINMVLGDEGKAISNPNAGPGFASGGVVPEEDEEPRRRPLSPRMEEAGYTTSATGERSSARQSSPEPSSTARAGAEDGADRETANVRPTKRLRDDVAKALDGGIKFLTRHFNLAGEGGAVPSPGDEAVQREGAMRWTKGEGAATPDEIKGIDAAIDPEGVLDEGDRHMNRLAQTVTWLQSRGRGEDAEAAAGSLLQYGRVRFGQLGSIAANQYEKFLETGDQDYLQGTVNMLEAAYKLVPDGAKVDVSINSESGQLQVTRIDAQGNEQDVPIQPQDLPQIIRGIQDGSTYWREIYRLADPAGAKEEATAARQEARDERTAARQEAHDVRLEEYRQGREDVRSREALAKEERTAKRQLEKEEREERRRDERYRREHPRTDWDAITPLLSAARAASKGIEDADDPDAAQAAYNQAATALFRELGKADRDPAGTMDDLGIYMDSFDMVDTGMSTPASPDMAQLSPMEQALKQQFPTAYKEGDSWFVMDNGVKKRVKVSGG